MASTDRDIALWPLPTVTLASNCCVFKLVLFIVVERMPATTSMLSWTGHAALRDSFTLCDAGLEMRSWLYRESRSQERRLSCRPRSLLSINN